MYDDKKYVARSLRNGEYVIGFFVYSNTLKECLFGEDGFLIPIDPKTMRPVVEE